MPSLRNLRSISVGTAAILALALAWALHIHTMGWGQLANFAQVRALADGEPEIDRWHWETQDKAWTEGHFYSVKAPGLAALTLPAYMGLDAAGADGLSATAAGNAAKTDYPHWDTRPLAPYETYGYNSVRAYENSSRIEDNTPLVWVLTLLGAVIPALLLLFGVRWIAERIEPGYGTAAAITLGIGSILMTFASEYFPHVIAAALGFAAFAILFRERRGPPRLLLVGAAGLIAGIAVNFEYPLVLAGAVLFFYALSRGGPRVPRAAAYAAGAVLGALPALAFNQWAFGSPLHFAYSDAVAVQGVTGHAVLGLNSDGLFGITVPEFGKAFELLLANRGLLALTPVLAMGVAGAVSMRGNGYRAEANVILAICAAYFVYNAGYWLPFGGGTLGPRFLIPTLPFVALGLAPAWKRWPAPTLALAIPSAIMMVAGTLTFPLLGDIVGISIWADRLADGDLEHTLLTMFGVEWAWLAAAPVLAAIGAAIALAAKATPRPSLGDIRLPVALVAIWSVLAIVGPTLVGNDSTPLDGGTSAFWLILPAAVVSIATLCALAYRERRKEPISRGIAVGEPALGERIS